MNLMKLGMVIALLMALPSLFGSGGGPGGGGANPGGPPVGGLDAYRKAAQGFLDAANRNDPVVLEPFLSTRGRRSQGGRANRFIQMGSEMIQKQGRLAKVGQIGAGKGVGFAILNAARGGWLMQICLDSDGKILDLKVESQ